MNTSTVIYTNPLNEWLWESGAMPLILIIVLIVMVGTGIWLAYESWHQSKTRKQYVRYLPPTTRWKLWKHMHDEHKLLLVESELDEIILLVRDLVEKESDQ